MSAAQTPTTETTRCADRRPAGRCRPAAAVREGVIFRTPDGDGYILYAAPDRPVAPLAGSAGPADTAGQVDGAEDLTPAA